MPHLIEVKFKTSSVKSLFIRITKELAVSGCKSGCLVSSSGDRHPGQRGQFELGGPVTDRRGRGAQRGRRSPRGARPHVRGLSFVQRQGREVQGRPQVRACHAGPDVEELWVQLRNSLMLSVVCWRSPAVHLTSAARDQPWRASCSECVQSATLALMFSFLCLFACVSGVELSATLQDLRPATDYHVRSVSVWDAHTPRYQIYSQIDCCFSLTLILIKTHVTRPYIFYVLFKLLYSISNESEWRLAMLY